MQIEQYIIKFSEKGYEFRILVEGKFVKLTLAKLINDPEGKIDSRLIQVDRKFPIEVLSEVHAPGLLISDTLEIMERKLIPLIEAARIQVMLGTVKESEGMGEEMTAIECKADGSVNTLDSDVDDFMFHHIGFWNRKQKLPDIPLDHTYFRQMGLTRDNPMDDSPNNKRIGEDSNIINAQGPIDPGADKIRKDFEDYEKTLLPGEKYKAVKGKVEFEETPSGCPPEAHNQSIQSSGSCHLCGRDWFI